MKKTLKSFAIKNTKKLALLALLLVIGVYNVYKPLPSNSNKAWDMHRVPAEDVAFITDTTYLTRDGDKVASQYIFNTGIQMIREAHSYILVDMFLWNDFLGSSTSTHRTIAQELAQELIAKKKSDPSVVIQVISDPINTSYEGGESAIFRSMQEAGVDVTFTNLTPLRDSNPVFSSLWRVFVWPIDILHDYVFGKPYTFRVIPNVINAGGEPVTLRSLFTLLNFKANHRKLIVTDVFRNEKVSLVSLVTSANPHDGSSLHSNVALRINGDIGNDIIASEQGVVTLSGKSLTQPSSSGKSTSTQNDMISVGLVTDGAIRENTLSVIDSTRKGDTIDLLMFYFSDSKIMDSLLEASARGVTIRIILDPNKDAFGREKNGIPNRETADSLVEKSNGSIQIRWCNTHGEQCHGKMLVVQAGDEKTLSLGSANYTRRNIGGYNFESNVVVTGTVFYSAWNDAHNYFDGLWYNNSYQFSTAYETYQDTSRFKKVIAWIMEHTGLGTF